MIERTDARLKCQRSLVEMKNSSLKENHKIESIYSKTTVSWNHEKTGW